MGIAVPNICREAAWLEEVNLQCLSFTRPCFCLRIVLDVFLTCGNWYGLILGFLWVCLEVVFLAQCHTAEPTEPEGDIGGG